MHSMTYKSDILRRTGYCETMELEGDSIAILSSSRGACFHGFTMPMLFARLFCIEESFQPIVYLDFRQLSYNFEISRQVSEDS